MLELPEVLTLSKQANDVLSGKTITQVFNATKPHKFTFYSGDILSIYLTILLLSVQKYYLLYIT